jgi:peroxiredoxin
MIKRLMIATSLISSFFLTSAFADDKAMSFKEYLEQANSYIKSYRHFEASDALKEATRLGGAKHPSLHMRLGILYYGLGLIPEAIAEGERAVHLAPSSKWYKYDLAKFYYVDKQFAKAEKQFTTLLRIDPGFTLAYYYLAKLYFKQKRYDMAWLSMSRAYQLGYKGQLLEIKIAPLSSKPTENLSSSDNGPKLFRFIKLSDARQAQELTNEIWNGKLFENLELELRKDQNSSADFGIMTLDELKPNVTESLQDKKPYSKPLVIQTGSDYRVMQRVLPFDPKEWQQNLTQVTPAQKPVIAKHVEPAPTPTATSGAISTASTATYIAEKSKEANAQISSKLAAFYALEAWKEAWETQNAKTYLSSYSPNFTPSRGLSLDAWKEKRTKSVFRPTSIKIVLEDPVVENLTESQLLITFKQSYTSNSYHDIVVKTLTMEKEENGWKIIKEREVKVIHE